MAATTVDTTLFGAPGVSDQALFHPGLVSIHRRIDFSKSNTAASTNYSLFGLPKSFVVLGTYIESGADKNGSYPAATEATLKWAASDSANDVELGDGFTPSATAYKRQTKMQLPVVTTTKNASTSALESVTVGADGATFDDGGIVYITPGAQTTGYMEITIFGFVPNADTLQNVVTPAPRAALQATATEKDNVGAADPYHGKSA